MIKSDSLPSFRLSNSSLESHFQDPQVPSMAGHRDRALSVTAATGEPKGRELTQPPPVRKQNVGKDVTRAPPVPSADRSLPLSSEKDFVVRQRRGKESLRSSPQKRPPNMQLWWQGCETQPKHSCDPVFVTLQTSTVWECPPSRAPRLTEEEERQKKRTLFQMPSQ